MNEILEQAKSLITTNPQKSLELFNEILANKKDDISALYGIAQLLLNDRQNQKAMEFAKRAINQNLLECVEILDIKSQAYGVLAIANERECNIHDAAIYLSAHQILADICANAKTHILDQIPHFESESFGAYSPNANYAMQFLEHGVLNYENDKEPFYALACVLVAFYHANIKPKNSEISKGYELPQNPSPAIKSLYANAMIFLALLAFDMENKEKAKAFLDEAGQGDLLYEAMKFRILSALALSQKDTQNAKELAQKALIYKSYKNHLVLANIALNLQDLKSAKEQIQKAKELAKNESQNAEILAVQAYVCLKQNDKQNAKELAQKALKFNQKLKVAIMVLLNLENEAIKKIDIMALLAAIHPYQKNTYKSIITTTTALSANVINANEESKNNTNEMFKGAKFSIALNAALALLDFYPDDAKNTMTIANAFAKNVNTNDAIKFYRHAAMIDEVKKLALKELSMLYYEQKDYEKAFYALEILIKDGKDDENIPIYQVQAEIIIEVGNKKLLEIAASLIEKIQKIEPENFIINILNAKILEKKGKYFDAINEAKIALEKCPNNEKALIILASCFNSVNEYEKWENCFKKLIDIRRQKIINDLKVIYQDEEIDVNDKRFLLLEDEEIISTMLWTSHYIQGKDEKENFKLAKRYGDIIAAKTRFVYDSYECENFGVNEILDENTRNFILNSAKNCDFEDVKNLEPLMANASACDALKFYLKNHGKKLRIGLTSGDLKNHPVGYVLEGAFKGLDKEIFELYAYATHNIEDDLSARIKPHFKSWQSIAGISKAAAAAKIHSDKINILLDLSGHTGSNALFTHAYKPAPIGATYIGCPFTTGLSNMDYMIGDGIISPACEHEVASERIFNLPKSWWHFTMPPDIDTNWLLAINQEAPYKTNGYFTFGSFNNLYKMNDTLVALWAKILLAVPDSKLFLNYKQLRDESQKERVIEWFGRYGVSKDRFILDYTTPRYKTLNAYNLVDLGLDTFPFCGFTTTAEAVMMGIAVIGLKGDSFATRGAYSILTNTNMSEFIANDLDEYFKKAVYFATTGRSKLEELRINAKERIKNLALFDTPRFTKDLENAFLQMWINYELGIRLR